MSYYGNYPPPGGYPNPYAAGANPYGAPGMNPAFPPSSGPPPPPGAGYGGYSAYYNPYGGGYGPPPGAPTGYGPPPGAYGGQAPPPMPVPPSDHYNMMHQNQAAWGAHQASMHTAKQMGLMDEEDLEDLRKARRRRMRKRLDDEDYDEDQAEEDRKADREMQDKMMEKMREMEEKMKVMQESGALEAQKHEMKQLFIDNLMKNQDLTGMFDPVAGTVEMFEEYDEADLVAAWFSAEKGEELVGKKWDPEYDAQYMRQAIKGWGTDEEAIIYLVSSRNNSQRVAIHDMYKTSYGRDLIEDLRGDTSGNLEATLIALFHPPAYFDAWCIKRALKGLGTDEHCLIEILFTRTPAQIAEIREVYESVVVKKKSGNPMKAGAFEEDIESDTSGFFKRLLVSASTGGRRMISREQLEAAVEEVTVGDKFTGQFRINHDNLVDVEKCVRMAQELHEAGEERWGTDEETFNRIFSVNDFYTLNRVWTEYVKISQRDIINSIDRESSGDYKRALRAIASSIKCRPLFFAERLRDSIKGAGTDDKTLIRVVCSRSEIDMVQIKACFLELVKQTLWKWIKDDTSGDYGKLLRAIVGKN